MEIKLRKLLLSLFFLMPFVSAWAQSDAYEAYIDKFGDLAVEQMKKYHIPASITLAQGLLESNAGRSALCRNANNHFGIKCGSEWTGAYYVMDDDYANEHFRVYGSALESYIDHSEFLSKRGRYAFLFNYSTTDYKNWAHGLKKAGYATNPRYGYLLIDLIERYKLYRFDSKHYSRHHTKDSEQSNNHSVYFCNKNYYIVARAGDTFKQLSKETGVSVRRLLKYNELDKNYTLQEGDVVFLEKKQKNADKSLKGVLIRVEAGESYHSIAQKYGLRLKNLYKMNNLLPNAQIYEGQELFVCL